MSNGLPTVVLVVDRIYPKTLRLAEKVRSALHGARPRVIVAIVEGLGQGTPEAPLLDAGFPIIRGTLSALVAQLQDHLSSGLRLVALNQSALLPCIAMSRLLDLPTRNAVAAACHKAQTRLSLSRFAPHCSVDAFVEVEPGTVPPTAASFEAAAYVVKPAFGTSGAGVVFADTWDQAVALAGDRRRARQWLAPDIAAALGPAFARSDTSLIEPYIDGIEFSVDGWILGNQYHAIVHHKLWTLRSSFVGDGPTVSPPMTTSRYPGAQALTHDEAAICEFGREVLGAISFGNGVFHIEGRERIEDGRLVVVEVNARAPGGSLWKTTLWRTGYDLELIDAAIQLGEDIPPPINTTFPHVLHLPIYAATHGALVDLGDLDKIQSPAIAVDMAVSLGQVFKETDMNEEPYLAFVAAGADTDSNLMSIMDRLLRMRRPSIREL